MSEFNEANLVEITEMLGKASENVDKVYNAGYAVGRKDGEKAEYDTFWDEYQDYGNRRHYKYFAAGYGWTPANFRPKYAIVATGNISYMFAENVNLTVDLVQLMDDLGLPQIAFSNINSISYAFYNSFVTHIGVVDMRGAVTNNSSYFAFASCKAKTIDKVIVAETTNLTAAFNNNSSLENITFEGTIGQSINFQWSTKLTKASITSIVEHLSDTVSGMTLTLSKTAVDEAFETSEGAKDGSTSEEWMALTDPKSNWTITLV